jgi:hypothetical protein
VTLLLAVSLAVADSVLDTVELAVGVALTDAVCGWGVLHTLGESGDEIRAWATKLARPHRRAMC